MSWPTQTARIGDVHRQPVPSAWEQAGAVVDRLWDEWPEGTLSSAQHDDGTVSVCSSWSPHAEARCGTGPTYVAALIDLGTRWAQDGEDGPEREEGGAHE